MNNGKLIISLYDYTGNWAADYIAAGYAVLLWDYQVEGDILANFNRLLMQVEEAQEAYPGLQVYGILAACPCTDFSAAGAWTWKKKDSPGTGRFPFDNQTESSEALVRIVLHLVDLLAPVFWAIENPVGRIETVVPELAPYRNLVFNPCDYGDPYTKKTILWGQFNRDLVKRPVPPVEGSKMLKVPGGKNQKNLRSATPRGFARAFYTANQ